MIVLLLALLSGQAQAAPPVLELEGELYTSGVQGAVAGAPWWESFGSPELNELMEAGLGGNFDALAAWSRVEQAEAISAQTFSSLLPSVSFDVSANTQPTSAVGFQFGIGGTPTPGQSPVETPELFHSGSAMFNASWQVDIWGRQLQQWQASRFDLQASRGDREAALVALSGRIAEAWLDVVAANARMDVLEAQLEAQESLLELVQLRYEQGGASAVDVLQQRQQVAALRSQLPTARTVQRTRAQQLGVLVGRLPSSTTVAQDVLPEPRPLPTTGIPADLVENRPDVRAAALRIDASHARKSSAVRALLPTLRLSGQAGVQATIVSEYQEQSTWGVGGTLSVPIFNGGRNLAVVKQARAAEDQSVYQYNQALLTALGEVEGALVVEAGRAEQLEAVRIQAAAAAAAYDNARERYLAGLDSYITVLTAWNANQQAELTLLQVHRDLLGARVQLHDALGGPWTGTLAVGVPR